MGLDSRFKCGYSSMKLLARPPWLPRSVSEPSQHMYDGVFRIVMAPFTISSCSVGAPKRLMRQIGTIKHKACAIRAWFAPLRTPYCCFWCRKDKWSSHNTSVWDHGGCLPGIHRTPCAHTHSLTHTLVKRMSKYCNITNDHLWLNHLI